MKTDCIFCDRSNIAGRIIAEDKVFYVVASLGQITQGGYVLLIPREHVPCFGAMTDDCMVSAITATRKILQMLSLEYVPWYLSGPGPVTIFEHGIIGQSVGHAHLHFLSVALDFTSRIRQDFPTAETVTLSSLRELREFYSKRQEPYLLWTTPSEKIMLCWSPEAKLQYLRTVAAELLGRPERGNWRDADRTSDQQLIADSISRLKPYFYK